MPREMRGVRLTGVDRAQLFVEMDNAAWLPRPAPTSDRASGQVSIFDMFETSARSRRSEWHPRCSHGPLTEKLAFEKELLGFYVTGIRWTTIGQLLESGKYRAHREARRAGG